MMQREPCVADELTSERAARQEANEARERAERESASLRGELTSERAARREADEARERAERESASLRGELTSEQPARREADEARERAERESEILLEKLTSERAARQVERASLMAERDASRSTSQTVPTTQAMHKPRYFKGQSDILSNFAPCSLKCMNRTFESTEQLYQYRKAKICDDEAAANNILKSQSPQIAKRLGDAIKTCSRWEVMKVDVMSEVLNVKLTQCERYRDELISTAKRPIVEYTSDRFWARGDPKLQDGLNVMGKLHELARHRLLNNLNPTGPRYKYCKAALVTKPTGQVSAVRPAERSPPRTSPGRTSPWLGGVNMNVPPPPFAPLQNVRQGWTPTYNPQVAYPWFPPHPTYSDVAQRYPPLAYSRFY